MLGIIFHKAQNKIPDPAKLHRLIVDLIEREQWTMLDADVKGDAYEGLLQKITEDTKSGAGQYFTPRPLIAAIVDVMRPEPGKRICDPACGTGGFLLAAHDYIMHHHHLDRDQKRFLKQETWKALMPCHRPMSLPPASLKTYNPPLSNSLLSPKIWATVKQRAGCGVDGWALVVARST